MLPANIRVGYSAAPVNCFTNNLYRRRFFLKAHNKFFIGKKDRKKVIEKGVTNDPQS